MAKISTYERDNSISREDLLTGSNFVSLNTYNTKNFKLADLVDFFSGQISVNASTITLKANGGLVRETISGTEQLAVDLGASSITGQLANSDLVNSTIEINGVEIPLGGTVSIPIGDITSVVAGTYLSGGGTINDVTLNHDNTTRSDTTSDAAPAYGATFTAIDSITTNATGHITAANLKTITIPASDNTNTQNTTTLSFVDSSNDIILRNTTGGAGSGNQDIKFVAGANITLNHTDANNIEIVSTDTNTVYTHPTHDGDDIDIDTGALINAAVISDLDFNITTDTLGHVTDANATIATRNLTLANLGYTGATDANNYTLPLAASGTRGGVKIGYSENGQNYPVELSSEQMYVNVPWVNTNILSGGTVTGNVIFNSDTFTIQSVNTTDPLVLIKNTTNDATAARLTFQKDRGAAAQDNDKISEIRFSEGATDYGLITVSTVDVSSGMEAGKMLFELASGDCSNSVLRNGLLLAGTGSSDTINATLGYGTGSSTTIAGDLIVSGGDISLGAGTGRIQGIDTVQNATDAASKQYVDAHVGTTVGKTNSSQRSGTIELIAGTNVTITEDGTTGHFTFASTDDNTDVDVNVGNLTARMPQLTESFTIGDANDVEVTFKGNVNIGTADDGERKLKIHGGAAGSAEGGQIELHTAADYDDAYAFYRIDAYQDDLRIGRTGTVDWQLNSSGYVGAANRLGVGTLNPNNILQVVGNMTIGTGSTNEAVRTIQTGGTIVLQATDANHRIIIRGTQNAAGTVTGNSNNMDFYEFGGYNFYTGVNTSSSARTLALGIASGGNVGVGITAPLGKIHTFSTSTNVDGDYGGNNFGIIVSQDNGNNAGDEGNGIVFTQQYAADNVDAGQVRTGAIIGHKVSATGSFGGGLKFKVQPAGANPLSTALTLSNNNLATFAGQISSPVGGFSTSANVNSTGDSGVNIASGSRLGFDQSGTRSWTINAAGGNLNINSGDGNGSFSTGTKGIIAGSGTFAGTGSFTTAANGSICTLDVKGGGNSGGAASLRLAANNVAVGSALDIIHNSSGAFIFHRANEPLVFGTNNTERMRIDSSGDITLGTSALGFLFDVSAQVFSTTFGTSGNLTLAVTNSSGTGVGGEIFLGGSTRGDALKNVISFRNGSSSEKMRISESGNVGIGEATPNAALQFASSVATRKVVLYENANNNFQFYGFGIENNILLYSTGANTDDHVFFSGQSTTTRREIARLKGNGNVGIGTNSPDSKLEVDGNIQSDTTSIANSAAYIRGADVGIGIGQSASSPYGSWIQSRRNTDGVAFPISLNPSGGNIGIGTASPDFELDVAGSIGIDDYIYHNGDHNTYIRAQADQWTFRTGGSDRMHINNTGVGIGVTAPSEKLEVNDGNIFVNGENHGIIVDSVSKRVGLMKYSGHEAYLARVASQDFAIVRVGGSDITDGSSITKDIDINGSGDTTFGGNLNVAAQKHISINPTSAADHALSGIFFNGNQGNALNVSRLSHNNAHGTFFFDVPADVGSNDISLKFRQYNVGGYMQNFIDFEEDSDIKNINGSYGTISSDIRVKENIVDATAKLDDILSLKVKNFNFIGSDKKQIGLIAQDVEKVFPSWVKTKDTRIYQTHDENGVPLEEQGKLISGFEDGKSLKVGMEFAIFVKTIQELNAKIDALEAKVTELENN